MSWLELSLAVPASLSGPVSDRLEALGAVAVTLRAAGAEEVLEPLPGEQPLWQEVCLDALFELDADLRAIRLALVDEGARVLDARLVEDDDWQSRWRAHAVRAVFRGRLRLLPRDEAVPEDGTPDAVVLRLDPGLAFGSGSHPTTRLCLDWLAGAALEGRRVLDFGCGSGILALAAIRLGAREVIAVDHDPQALAATLDNAAYNAIGTGIEGACLQVGEPALVTRPGTEPFDVLVANILANPLVELAPQLTALVRPGGSIVLSGLLADQADRIRAAYPDVRFAPPVMEEDWIRLDGIVG